MIKILLSLLLASNCAAAGVKEKKPVPPKTKQAVVEGICSFEVPAGWTVDADSYSRQTGVSGVKIAAPDSSPEKPAFIYADYYPADNKISVSSAAYLSQLTAPGTLRPVGRKIGKPQPAKLGALTGSSVQIDSMELYPPEALSPKKIPVTEKVVVAGAEKGFFVFSCYAAKGLYSKTSAYFDTVLKTFKQLPQNPK